MATLPLQSCRMVVLLAIAEACFGGREPEYGDRSGLGTAVEANAAAGAVRRRCSAPDARRTHSVSAASSRHLGGQDSTHSPHPLHSSRIDANVSPCLGCHSSPRCVLICGCWALQPLGLLAIFVKLVTELGMRDLDQRLGSLADRLAVQVRDAVFGHDVVHESARCHHARARS